MTFDLAVVMPIYNEDACIVDVIKSWHAVLSGLDIKFLIFALNDGSTDKTEKVLEIFNGQECIRVINKINCGHGPTILAGYGLAVKEAVWVFQCDSDNEMSPAGFPFLWEKRENFDALFGVRYSRKQNSARWLISVCSRLTVRLLYGSRVTDVNTPYRLMRADILKKIIEQIPQDTFAPNVIISGTLIKSHVRIYEQGVTHSNRKTGKTSIVKWKLWRAAMRAFLQTLVCRPVLHLDNL